MKMILKNIQNRSAQNYKIQTLVIFSEDFRKASTIGVYLNMNDEVATDLIIESTFFQHKILALPKIENDMKFYEYKKESPLVHNQYGILEPLGEKEIVPDLIVVPGLAFDRDGRRLGRGKGFYDRYLEKYKPPQTIGICFTEQILSKVEVDPWDKKVHKVVFPEKL